MHTIRHKLQKSLLNLSSRNSPFRGQPLEGLFQSRASLRLRAANVSLPVDEITQWLGPSPRELHIMKIKTCARIMEDQNIQ